MIMKVSDRVSFGKYLLSEQRDNLMSNSPNEINRTEGKREVYDADIANWQEEQKQN